MTCCLYTAHMQTKKEEIEYPVRINRYLLLKNYCSRREADRVIERGEVTVNGTLAVLGQKVSESDVVKVSSRVANRSYKYYIFNKPRGVVSHSPQRDEKSVADISGLGTGVSVVGRLDKDSEGLMLLTDDGRIVDALLNPKYAHERTYDVTVDKRIKESDLRLLAKGVVIEGYHTKPATTERIADNQFLLTLTEGKKHQIRRMCAALGYQVLALKRVQMMGISLDIPLGINRKLNNDEVASLLALCNTKCD